MDNFIVQIVLGAAEHNNHASLYISPLEITILCCETVNIVLLIFLSSSCLF